MLGRRPLLLSSASLGALLTGGWRHGSSQNAIYVLQLTTSDFAAIGAAPVSTKVIEPTSDSSTFWTSTQVSQMRGAGGGKLIGYADFGLVESFRPYYNTTWQGLPSATASGIIINPSTPVFGSGATSEYNVKFWDTAWVNICKKWIDLLVAAGWDGWYFDVVDGWNYANTSSDPVVVAAGGLQQSANLMVGLISTLDAYGKAQKPGFITVVNGAEILHNPSVDFPTMTAPTNPSYADTFNVQFKEQVCYSSFNNPLNTANRNFEVALLDFAKNAGKPVVLIEYVDNASNVPTSTTETNDVKAFCAAHGYSYYIAASNQNLNGVDAFGWS